MVVRSTHRDASKRCFAPSNACSTPTKPSLDAADHAPDYRTHVRRRKHATTPSSDELPTVVCSTHGNAAKGCFIPSCACSTRTKRVVRRTRPRPRASQVFPTREAPHPTAVGRAPHSRMQHVRQRTQELLRPKERLLHACEAHGSTDATTPPSVACRSDAGAPHHSAVRRAPHGRMQHARRRTQALLRAEAVLAPSVRSTSFDARDHMPRRRTSFRRRKHVGPPPCGVLHTVLTSTRDNSRNPCFPPKRRSFHTNPRVIRWKQPHSIAPRLVASVEDRGPSRAERPGRRYASPLQTARSVRREGFP
jgi:hypothetical protein